MKQSRVASLIETIGSTVFGFIITLAAQPIVYPWFGFHPTLTDNLGLVAIFTALSVARGYAWRRIGEALHVRRPLSPFMRAVIAERFRQIEVEGWDEAHDDKHMPGEIARAGAAYAIHAANYEPTKRKGSGIFQLAHSAWPWSSEWWKPQSFRRDLVRAGALIIAEGEKYDCSRKVKS